MPVQFRNTAKFHMRTRFNSPFDRSNPQLAALFVYAPAFTLFVAGPPAWDFKLRLWLFDVVLILALAYPLLFLLAR